MNARCLREFGEPPPIPALREEPRDMLLPALFSPPAQLTLRLFHRGLGLCCSFHVFRDNCSCQFRPQPGIAKALRAHEGGEKTTECERTVIGSERSERRRTASTHSAPAHLPGAQTWEQSSSRPCRHRRVHACRPVQAVRHDDDNCKTRYLPWRSCIPSRDSISQKPHLRLRCFCESSRKSRCTRPKSSPKQTMSVGTSGEAAVSGRTRTLVLNCRSAENPFRSFFAVHESPSSSTIFPHRIPRAYMFGIEMTYSARTQRY